MMMKMNCIFGFMKVGHQNMNIVYTILDFQIFSSSEKMDELNVCLWLEGCTKSANGNNIMDVIFFIFPC